MKILGLAALMTASAVPSNCRLYLAGQYDWGNRRGFYLDFEGSKLAELPVILGLADGTDWRFISHRPGFLPDRDYRIRAVIGPDKGALWVDGRLVAESPGRWQPATEAMLEVNYRPAWADELGDWLGIVRTVEVEVSRDRQTVARKSFDWQGAAARPVPLQLFEPGQPASEPLALQAGDTVTVDCQLRFALADLQRWSPLVDRYGQHRFADWPEKVHSDEELRADIAQEDARLAQMPPSPDFDQYGGYLKAGWREAPTGFFRTVRRGGRWWLITPTGHPCFYLGVCSVPAQTWETTPVSGREFLFEWLPPREPPWAAAWNANLWGLEDGTEYVCFYTCNLIRKYGPIGWAEQAEERALRRIRAWGFSGGGKWGAPASMVSLPVLGCGGTPRLANHPDFLDPRGAEAFRQELERQIAPRRDDPRVLGWSLGNEYEEIIKRDDIAAILAAGSETPAKRLLIDQALNEFYGGSLQKLSAAWAVEAADRSALYAATPSPPPEDLEKLRCFYADRYYEFIYRAVKALDPNHLYFGFWIVPGWWENEQDWFLIARHCDVLGYDRYSPTYQSDLVARLQAETDRPTFCGEFSFPAWYQGLRGFGRYGAVSVQEDAEAGDLYARWVRAAAKDPYCIGMTWFLYRDQPITGRGPGHGPRAYHGEHFAFGLVTETDRPKWPMVQRMREANLQAAAWRLEAAAQ